MDVERFAQLIVGGGVVLVASLWIVAFVETWSVVWLLGIILALLGAGGVVAGIGSEIEV